MSDKWILRDRELVPATLMEWAMWFENTSNRRVANDSEGDVRVSTMFLGTEHGYTPDGAPLVFETEVIGGEHDYYQERYATYDEAEAGHARICAMVGITP
jgi:hypothetical protein